MDLQLASVSRSTREFIARVCSSRCFLLDQAEPGAPKSTLGLPVLPPTLLLPVLELADCVTEGESEMEVGAAAAAVEVADWLLEGVVSAGGESGASIMGESADS